MSIWKKAISVTATAALLASLFVTTIGAGSVFAFTAPCDATYSNGPYGTSYQYCTNVTERPADGTSYIVLNFPGSAGATGATLLQISVTGGTFINGTTSFAAATVGSYPRTSLVLTGAAPLPVTAGSQLWLASNTAGTATVTVQYSTGVTQFDSTQSFTFTTASLNVPSSALSYSKITQPSGFVSSPASANKASGDVVPETWMTALVLDQNGHVIPSGVTVEWTITGPALFGGTACGTTTGANTYKNVGTPDSVTGFAESCDIASTGAGGTATITTTVKYLGVSYALPDKVINFVGDPASITCANAYYVSATGTNQEGVDNGAFECNVLDANKFQIMSGVTFTTTSPTPAAFWTTSGVNSWSTTYNDWEVGVACGGTAGSNSAIIKATVGTKSVSTSAPLTYTCSTALDDGANIGTLSIDTSGGTTVQPGGQLAINAIVKDKNGLPAPDGTVVQAATNGVGNVVRVTKAQNSKGTVNGIAKFLFLAPPTSGNAVVTFFGQGVTTPSNVSVTVTVGSAVTAPFGASVKGGASTQGALSSSVCSASCSGNYGTATPVVKAGQYISWRATVGGTYAGKTAYVWVSKKSSSGTWGAWTLLTSRIADNSGTVVFNWRLSSAGWYSLLWSTSSSSSDFMTVLHSVARQGRWVS